jgi:hypothetical protein
MELCAASDIVIDIIAILQLVHTCSNLSGCSEIQGSPLHGCQGSYGNELLIQGCILRGIDGEDMITDSTLESEIEITESIRMCSPSLCLPLVQG